MRSRTQGLRSQSRSRAAVDIPEGKRNESYRGQLAGWIHEWRDGCVDGWIEIVFCFVFCFVFMLA